MMPSRLIRIALLRTTGVMISASVYVLFDRSKAARSSS